MDAKKLSRISWASCYAFFIVIWYWLTSVQRVPLPPMDDTPPKLWKCHVHLSGAEDAQDFLNALKMDLEAKFHMHVKVAPNQFCTTDCAGWLRLPREKPLACAYELYVSRGPTELALNDDMEGWLRLENAESVGKGVELLGKTWFQKLHDDKVVALAPLYAFSFFYVSEGARRVSWNFHTGVEQPLSDILNRVNVLFDFDLESQVVLTARLTNIVRGEKVALANIQSHFLQDANMWGTDITADTMYRPPPIIKFAAFSPSRPLVVIDDAELPVSSFFVQGWGAVSIMTHNSTDLRPAISGWVGHMRSRLLHLPADPFYDDPQIKLTEVSGLSVWELHASLRVICLQMQRKSIDTLRGVHTLVHELTGIEVPERVGLRFASARMFYEKAHQAIEDGDIEQAMDNVKKSFILALENQHDDAMVANLHFSWEFTAAIYLPIVLPTVLPILNALKSFRT